MKPAYAFDVCHEVYVHAREVLDQKLPTIDVEGAVKYQWRPDRLPKLKEYVADFVLAGERALGLSRTVSPRGSPRQDLERASSRPIFPRGRRGGRARPGRVAASRLVLFRLYYCGGAEYHAARRHLGISELTWANWADEIRSCVGRELLRAGLFPPGRYFKEWSGARPKR